MNNTNLNSARDRERESIMKVTEQCLCNGEGDWSCAYCEGRIPEGGIMTGKRYVYCPQCDFYGTESEVDDHRATGVHNDEPQAGSNEPNRRKS